MRSIKTNAPAKINIGLNILSKRDDGFHNLKTFFYPIYDLYDSITFEKSDQFSFSSTDPSIKSSSSNLIVKALTIVEQIINKKLDVKIILEKKIPIGGGLGGGSSDAASTLLSINSNTSPREVPIAGLFTKKKGTSEPNSNAISNNCS